MEEIYDITDDAVTIEPLLLKYLMDHIPDTVYFKDLQSRFISVNHAKAQRAGVRNPELMVGRTDHDYFSAEHADRAYEDEQRIIRTGEPMINIQEKLTWPDGRVTWSSSTKLPLRDATGRIIGTFGISRDITEQVLTNEKLVTSEENLRIQTNLIQQDLERAALIQKSMLPAQTPDLPWLKSGACYDPLEKIGGDYYQFFELEEGRHGVFLGDLTGHGVSSALVMAVVKFVTDRLSRSCGNTPAVFLEQVNHELINQLPSFLTAVYLCFEPQPAAGKVRVQLAGAGHPPPVVWRKATGKAGFVELSSMGAIGIFPNFKSFDSECELHPGDRLFLFTDGLFEVYANQEDVFNFKHLPRIVEQAQQETLDATLETIFSKMRDINYDGAYKDDVTLLGYEITAPA